MTIKFPKKLVAIESARGLPALAFYDDVSGCSIEDARVSSCGRFAVEPSQYGLTEADADTLRMLNELVESAHEAAINAAALHIQKALGVKFGDIAGWHFSGLEKGNLNLADYIIQELEAA
jgi:hypothetical protein